MSATIVPLVPTSELDVIKTYLDGGDAAHLEPVFDRMAIPEDAEPERIRIAVAQILLCSLQEELPSWSAISSDGSVTDGRAMFERDPDSPLARLRPELICSINWADSGPGFSWPEAYYITRIPGLEVHVVTASQDSSDAWGCTDQAIGFCPASCSETEAARQIVTGRWRELFEVYSQERWECVLDDGIAASDDVDDWADEVWGLQDEEEQDE